jgi:hypothetical protein
LDNENIRARQFLLRPNKFAHWETGKIEKYLKFESLHQSFVDLDRLLFFQATFEGWIEIMADAADVTEVRPSERAFS